MNIQISEALLNKEKSNTYYFPRSFFQNESHLLFIGEDLSQTYFDKSIEQVSFYSSIKLEGKEPHFSLSKEVVILKVDNESEELLEILPISSIPEKEHNTVWLETLESLFLTLRNEKEEADVVYSSDIVPVLHRALECQEFEASAFNSGKTIEIGLFDGFLITGEATTGHYEGNVIMTNWKVIERYSDRVIVELGNSQLPLQLFIEEGEEEDVLLEALVESMSREYIISLAIDVLNKEIKKGGSVDELKAKVVKENEGHSN